MKRAPLLAVFLALAACNGDETRSPVSPTPGSPGRTASPVQVSPASPPGAASARVWAALEGAREVVLVDVAERRVVRRFEVPGSPHNLTVADDGTVAAALQRSGLLAIVRDEEVIPVELGGSPHDVKPVGELFVVANEGDARLDLVTRDGRHEGSIGLKADPHDLAITPDGRGAWVSLDGSDEIAVVDLERREVDRYVGTGRRPHDLLFAPDGRLWVTDWDGDLHVLSPDGEIVRSLSVGEEAHHLTFSTDPPRGWVVDHGTETVAVVDVDTLEVVTSAPTFGDPHHVAITADGRFAVVANHERGVLQVYDADTADTVAEIDVGPAPHGVWAGR